LDAITTIDFHFAFVIFPNYSKLNDALGDLLSLAEMWGNTVITGTTFFNSGFFSKSVLLSRVDKISSLA